MSNASRRFSVALTDPRWSNLQCEEEHLGDIADLQRFYCRSEEELILNCSNADALLVTYAPVTRRVIGSLKKCQVISVYGIGVDMVDVQAATEAGIPVTNVPSYCIEEVCKSISCNFTVIACYSNLKVARGPVSKICKNNFYFINSLKKVFAAFFNNIKSDYILSIQP